MTQTVTAGYDARRLGIALDLFLHAFGRQWAMRALLSPEHQAIGYDRGPYGETGAEGPERIGGQIHDTIFPSFPLLNPYGLLSPVNIVHAQACGFTDAQTSAQHDQRQGAIHGMRDLGEQGTDVVLREWLGQRATPAQEMTRFDRVAREAVFLHHEILEEMFEGIEPPVDRSHGQVRLALLLDKGPNVPPGDRTGGF